MRVRWQEEQLATPSFDRLPGPLALMSAEVVQHDALPAPQEARGEHFFDVGLQERGGGCAAPSPLPAMGPFPPSSCSQEQRGVRCTVARNLSVGGPSSAFGGVGLESGESEVCRCPYLVHEHKLARVSRTGYHHPPSCPEPVLSSCCTHRSFFASVAEAPDHPPDCRLAHPNPSSNLHSRSALFW